MSENNFQITRLNFIIFIIGCIAVSSLIISVLNGLKTDTVSTPTIKYNGTDGDFKEWFTSPDGTRTIIDVLNKTDLNPTITNWISNTNNTIGGFRDAVKSNCGMPGPSDPAAGNGGMWRIWWILGTTSSDHTQIPAGGDKREIRVCNCQKPPGGP